eukprot:TCONS_00063605-protein
MAGVEFETTESTLKELSKNSIRRAYLVTYSQCDLRRFPTRQSFGDVVAEAFRAVPGKVQPLYWACGKEPHPNTSGYHYHVSVLLNGTQRWGAVKDFLTKRHDVVVNFVQNDNGYDSAYAYVTKADGDVYHSENHPHTLPVGTPGTRAAMNSYAKRRRKRVAERAADALGADDTGFADMVVEGHDPRAEGEKSCHRLTLVEVADFCIQQSIKTRKELQRQAELQKRDGKLDLYHFILARRKQLVEDLIDNVWEMKNSVDMDIERGARDRMHVLYDLSNSPCVPGCEDELWKRSALQILEYNNIDWATFADAVKLLLRRGRGKYRNVMLYGDVNCAKTFLLKPLTHIYKTFENPARDKYCWVGADAAEVILINDLRWKHPGEQISWDDFLRLLEGEPTKLPAPKNHFAKDVLIDKDTPIFATGPYRLRNNKEPPEARENRMMDVRWRYFEFYRRLTDEEVNDSIPPCPRCFAEFVLHHA